jgi:mRNA interferase MazF
MTVGRGDIFLVDFEPSRGAEAGKQRPAIIVSNAGTNRGVFERGWGVLNVVPLTRSVSVIRRHQVLIPAVRSGLDHDSKAQAEHVRAVSIGRLGRQIGAVPPALMEAIDNALRIQLAL